MKSFVRSVKNNVMNYDEAERLVREATNSDPWGASSTLMYKIVAFITDKEQYHAAMRMLWKRLTDMTNSQHVLKALLLTEFLLRNASERFVLDMKMRIRRFESLSQFSDFKNIQQVTKDVRSKANAVLHLLNDDEHRKEERKVAQRMREKMIGTNSCNSNTTTGMSRGHTAAFQNQPNRSRENIGWQEHPRSHDATESQTSRTSTQNENEDDKQSFTKNKKRSKKASKAKEISDQAIDLDQNDAHNAAKKERKSNKKKHKIKKKKMKTREGIDSPSRASEDNNANRFEAFYADAQQDSLVASGPNNSSSNNEFLFSSAPAASGPALLDDLMGSFDSALSPDQVLSPVVAASATAKSGNAAEFLSGIDMQTNVGGDPAPFAAPDPFESTVSEHLQQNYQQPHMQQQHFQQQHLQQQQHFHQLQQQQFRQQQMHQQHFQQQPVQQQSFQQQPINAFCRQSSDNPPNPYWTADQQKQQYEQAPAVQPAMIQKVSSKSEPQAPEKAVSDWNGQNGDLWELTKDLTSLDSMTTPREEPKAPPQHTDSTWRDSPSYGLPPMQQQKQQQMPYPFQQQQMQVDPRQYQQQQMQMDPRQYQQHQMQMDPRQYQQQQMQMDPRQYQQHMQQYQ